MTTVALSLASAQQDPIQRLNETVKKDTNGTFGFTLDERTRWEEKDGVNFGKSVNQQDMLSRVRIGVWYEPAPWFKITVMGQDARAPFYGLAAPNSMRDTMDLQEAYIEFLGKNKTGFGATLGRQVLAYGESRLIGASNWSNASREMDAARVYYRTEGARFEVVMLSPTKIQTDAFDKPVLGERIAGTYNTFTNVWRGSSIDAYVLQHSQNKIGGWTGAGTLGTQTFGGRFYGKLPYQFLYNVEGIGQTGHLGLLTQRAHAWAAGASRKVTVGKLPLNLSTEYKEASGSKLGQSGTSTFDQLSPANHDKFGQEDLFGWRNLRNFKALTTLNLTKTFALNVMYNNNWLYSSSDSLYNSSGNSISISKKGIGGTHVGQELDTFATYRYGAHLFGAGFGHFFQGEFVARTTSHINPRYFYVFQQYSFK